MKNTPSLDRYFAASIGSLFIFQSLLIYYYLYSSTDLFFLFIFFYVSHLVVLFFSIPKPIYPLIRSTLKAFSFIFLILLIVVVLFRLSYAYFLSGIIDSATSCFYCDLMRALFYQFKFHRLITLPLQLFAFLTLGSLSFIILESLWFSLKRKSTFQPMVMIIVLSVLIPLILSFAYVFDRIASESIQLISSAGETNDEKLFRRLGGKGSAGWSYEYAKFVNAHSEKDARILIPPQMAPWLIEGNADYFRWYIYPRYLVRTYDLDEAVPQTANYVLIAYGNSGLGQGKVYGWPRIPIPEEKIDCIIYIDRYTLEETDCNRGNYIPDFINEKWGLIKLRSI